MLARDAVHERLAAEEIHAAFEPLADALGDADRRRVPRPDQADHARLAELGERVLERAPRALGRVALAPRAAGERPDALETRPAVRIEEPDAADERTARAFLDRPHTVAAQLPVTEEHRHLPPRFPAGERLAGGAEVAHDLGIGGHRRVRVQIGLAKHPQAQAFGLERDHGEPNAILAVSPRHGARARRPRRSRREWSRAGSPAPDRAWPGC